MEFIKKNYLNTTTMITVNSNTTTVENLFNRDPFFQYFSEGKNSDLSYSTITITFTETTTVSRIALMDTNVKGYTLFYNGSTANTFALSGANTTVSSFTGNDQENVYLRFPTTAVSSITLDMKSTQTANQEKRLGIFVLSDLYFAMGQIPDSGGYKPKIDSKQVVHKMSDGGTRIHNVRRKTAVDISLDYIPTAQRDSLKTIFELQDQFIFCPFGTSTGWDGILFESIWEGDFDFYEYSDNAQASGFSGKIRLRETPV